MRKILLAIAAATVVAGASVAGDAAHAQVYIGPGGDHDRDRDRDRDHSVGVVIRGDHDRDRDRQHCRSVTITEHRDGREIRRTERRCD